MKNSNSQNLPTKIEQFELANMKVAELHGKSRKIYLNLYGKDSQDQNELFNIARCPCCNYPAEGQNFSVFCRAHDLSELGSSFPLFFKYSKYLMLSLLLVLLIACIATTADNYSQDSYSDWSKEKSINMLTPANFGDSFEASFWQPILHVVSCGLLVFFYAWVIRNIKEHSVDYDTNVTTPADFTIMVKNLPNDYTKKDLKYHIEENFMLKNLKVVNVVCSYDVQDYVNCARELNDFRSQYLLVKNYEDKHHKALVVKKMCKSIELQGPEECLKRIAELEALEKTLKDKMNIEKLAPVAFVTFNSQTNARLVASEWGRTNIQIIFDNIFTCLLNKRHWFKGNYVHAEMAPDHTDINWENLAVSRKEKWIKRSTSVIVALLTLCVATGIMAGTSKWKAEVHKNKENESADSIRAATIIPTLITMVTNFTVARLIRLFANKEKYATWTDYNRAVLNKLIIFYLLNNIGIPMFVYSDPDNEWFSPGGLAYTVFWLQIMNCCVSPAMYLINPKNLIKKLQRALLLRSESQNDVRVSQKVANLAFEGPDVDLADRFANITKIFTMSLFFSPLVPIGVPIGIFGLIFEALVFKVMLIRVHSRPKWYNSDLVIRAAEWMRWGLFMYSLGILVFYQKLVRELWPLELFFFVAMAAYVFTPISTVCICCFKDRTLEIVEKQFEGDTNHDNFFKFLPKFNSDFERENPATSEVGGVKWKKFVEGGDNDCYLADLGDDKHHVSTLFDGSHKEVGLDEEKAKEKAKEREREMEKAKKVDAKKEEDSRVNLYPDLNQETVREVPLRYPEMPPGNPGYNNVSVLPQTNPYVSYPNMGAYPVYPQYNTARPY